MSDDWINVADAERSAAEKLEAGPHGYFAGGAGDEETLRDNVAAWRRWRLRPRVMTGAGPASTAAELLGTPLSMPVLIAPVALQRLVDPEGEVAMARAAAVVGTVMCLSTLATSRPSEVAAAAPGARHWFQLYPFKDAAVTDALIDEAVESGFEAIVVTVDAPPGGNRERDRRSGFRLPADLEVPSLGAAFDGGRGLTIEEAFSQATQAIGWDQLQALIDSSRVPVLVKGVLTAEDAALALACGVAGVIVSNHGGRQLDRSPATADALPELVAAVDGRASVLVDGGIRRGVDIAIALALGADAVLVGRSPLWGLAAAGEAGARRVLELLRKELELTLTLCGCASPGALGPDHVRRAPATPVYSVQ